MKKYKDIVKEFGEFIDHDSRIESIKEDSLQVRIRRMVATHVVETPVGVPDFDDPEGEPSKSMELRPDADFRADRFDQAERLLSDANNAYKTREAEAEIARRAKLNQPTQTSSAEPKGAESTPNA